MTTLIWLAGAACGRAAVQKVEMVNERESFDTKDRGDVAVVNRYQFVAVHLLARKGQVRRALQPFDVARAKTKNLGESFV